MLCARRHTEIEWQLEDQHQCPVCALRAEIVAIQVALEELSMDPGLARVQFWAMPPVTLDARPDDPIPKPIALQAEQVGPIYEAMQRYLEKTRPWAWLCVQREQGNEYLADEVQRLRQMVLNLGGDPARSR